MQSLWRQMLCTDQRDNSRSVEISRATVMHPSTNHVIYSIGHSTMTFDDFSRLLNKFEVEAVADVRSSPYSNRFPHFSRQPLQANLKAIGINYVFLGKELGGRPTHECDFSNGIADYEKMGERSEFGEGINRLVSGMKKYRIALLCSEHDPLECHRCLLVGRALKEIDVMSIHILRDGSEKTQEDVERELMDMYFSSNDDLFLSKANKTS